MVLMTTKKRNRSRVILMRKGTAICFIWVLCWGEVPGVWFNMLWQSNTVALFVNSYLYKAYFGHVYTGTDKFLHGQKLARFHLAFTRDRRSWTKFWTAKCAGLAETWKKQVPNLHMHLAVGKSVQFRRSHLNARRNRASFCPWKNLFGPV